MFDVITAFVLIAYAFYDWFSPMTVFFHAIYLGVKGVIFFIRAFASKIDIVFALYMTLVAFGIFSVDKITIIAFLWLIQKGLFAMWNPLGR